MRREGGGGVGARDGAGGHTDPQLGGTDVDAGGVGMEGVQEGKAGGVRGRRLGLASGQGNLQNQEAEHNGEHEGHSCLQRWGTPLRTGNGRPTHGGSGRGSGGCRQSSQRDRRRPGETGRVVTNDEAAGSPIQAPIRAQGTTARTDTATRCHE